VVVAWCPHQAAWALTAPDAPQDYHSKYNPIERVFGVLENYWNGDPLTSVAMALGLIEPGRIGPSWSRACLIRLIRSSICFTCPDILVAMAVFPVQVRG